MGTRLRGRRASGLATLLAAAVMLVGGCELLPGDTSLSGNDRATVDDQTLIEIGETRSSITARLGEPAERMSWTKHDKTIFGPIESFWAEVPLDATIEIWRFPLEDAWLEAYFVGGSDTVNGTAVAPKDAVY